MQAMPVMTCFLPVSLVCQTKCAISLFLLHSPHCDMKIERMIMHNYLVMLAVSYYIGICL